MSLNSFGIDFHLIFLELPVEVFFTEDLEFSRVKQVYALSQQF